ncbi:unnamed protein product, partial [Thelazia callipaeda]|uniref:CDP-diacylglycerol--serine O-phosphatidyltransferase n=1 Tax=Thelazia callipaeda TaxID=103827 RepID=A0A0N5DCK0_THECL
MPRSIQLVPVLLQTARFNIACSFVVAAFTWDTLNQ